MVSTIMAPSGQSAVRTEVERLLLLQKKNQQIVAHSTARDRIRKLNRLYDAVTGYRKEIQEALHADFRKHPLEADLGDVYKILTDIRFTRKRLSKWMRPRKVATPLSQIGSSSYIHYEPKGIVLIISPWNFPFTLTFGPMISAIAAGNCIILKPSELTPHSSALIRRIVQEIFDESEAAVVEGDVEVSTELLKLPFNHIFFTGAPEIGKVVMRAAAGHLASVTLELGGKSPTIVDETANLDQAASRLAFAKFLNNGQMCFAPDYAFVHQSVMGEFLERLKARVEAQYGQDPSASPSYNRIVNNKHFRRIEAYLNDALSKGARVVYGGKTDAAQDYVSPTIVTDVPENSDLWEKEIFGPILPLIPFHDLQEVIDKVNAKEKPLALYIFSKSKENVNRIIRNTRAGATVVNVVGVHFFNNNLPFGGVNNSGIGKGNGFFGFEEFSNARAVLRQWSPINGLDTLTPPYTEAKQKLIDFMIKWF